MRLRESRTGDCWRLPSTSAWFHRPLTNRNRLGRLLRYSRTLREMARPPTTEGLRVVYFRQLPVLGKEQGGGDDGRGRHRAWEVLPAVRRSCLQCGVRRGRLRLRAGRPRLGRWSGCLLIYGHTPERDGGMLWPPSARANQQHLGLRPGQRHAARLAGNSRDSREAVGH